MKVAEGVAPRTYNATMATCIVPDCSSTKIESRTLCTKHYRQLKRGALDTTGLTLPPPRKAVDDDGRFHRYVTVTGFCWEWTGSRSSNGYGQIRIKGRLVPAHRWAYEVLVGEIPEGCDMDHLCRNALCVNPDHLDPVPHVENIERGLASFDGARKGRCKRGHSLLDPDNLMILGSGKRRCRECQRMRQRNYASRKATTT